MINESSINTPLFIILRGGRNIVWAMFILQCWGNQNPSASFYGGSGSIDMGVRVMCYCGEKTTLRTVRTLKNKGKTF